MNYNKCVSQNEYWWIAIGLSILFIITPMFYSTGIIILIFSINSFRDIVNNIFDRDVKHYRKCFFRK